MASEWMPRMTSKTVASSQGLTRTCLPSLAGAMTRAKGETFLKACQVNQSFTGLVGRALL